MTLSSEGVEPLGAVHSFCGVIPSDILSDILSGILNLSTIHSQPSSSVYASHHLTSSTQCIRDRRVRG